jgi:signal transduction histidine kinase
VNEELDLGLLRSGVSITINPNTRIPVDNRRSPGPQEEKHIGVPSVHSPDSQDRRVIFGPAEFFPENAKRGQIQESAMSSLANTAALAGGSGEIAILAMISSLGVLTASIAHEVNQPLSGIITNASTCLRMLAADPPNVDGAREAARRAIRDGNRASEVVTRMRALFSQKDARAEIVDLNETTREAIALTLGELQRNKVVLRLELADDLPLIAGDCLQLQEVILNLLRNASDAMSNVDDRPRQLLIRTERDQGSHVRLTVQDTGVGFEVEASGRLFEPFFTTKNSGMGIGLSVSRSIIERHHGAIWAAPNDGPGATFAFSIPSKLEAVSRTNYFDASHAGEYSKHSVMQLCAMQ